jgi:glycosyltransferase involved in cell wall biosynthesis
VLERAQSEDARIVTTRLDTAGGASRARNRALGVARGDLVVYLDDDNRFDPDWLRAVAWAFTEHPDVNVAYGARIVDDVRRHHGLDAGGLPWMQLLAWDRDLCAEQNIVDQNVLVHRRGFADARFDERLTHYSDWDLVLQLTRHEDPLVLPAVAACFTTDAPSRLSHEWGAPDVVAQYEYVRAKDERRRSRP